MRQAIRLAASRPARPFAAVVVDRRTGLVVARGTNQVRVNPLWHAEIDALKQLVSIPRSDYAGLILYTTAEPCPMCISAILWAGISEVVFGTGISRLVEFGWNQIPIEAREVTTRAVNHHCNLIEGVLQNETDLLFSAGPPRGEVPSDSETCSS